MLRPKPTFPEEQKEIMNFTDETPERITLDMSLLLRI